MNITQEIIEARAKGLRIAAQKAEAHRASKPTETDANALRRRAEAAEALVAELEALVYSQRELFLRKEAECDALKAELKRNSKSLQ